MTVMRKTFCGCLLALFLLARPAAADAPQIDGAIDAIETMISAFNAGDLTAIVAARPEAYLHWMAETTDMTREAILDVHAERVRRSLDLVTIKHSALLPDTAMLRQTATGRVFVQAMVEDYWRWDELNMTRHLTPVIAVQDADRWAVIVINQPVRILMQLQAVFPDLAEMDLPQPHMEHVRDNALPDGLVPAPGPGQ